MNDLSSLFYTRIDALLDKSRSILFKVWKKCSIIEFYYKNILYKNEKKCSLLEFYYKRMVASVNDLSSLFSIRIDAMLDKSRSIFFKVWKKWSIIEF